MQPIQKSVRCKPNLARSKASGIVKENTEVVLQAK